MSDSFLIRETFENLKQESESEEVEEERGRDMKTVYQ